MCIRDSLQLDEVEVIFWLIVEAEDGLGPQWFGAGWAARREACGPTPCKDTLAKEFRTELEILAHRQA